MSLFVAVCRIIFFTRNGLHIFEGKSLYSRNHPVGIMSRKINIDYLKFSFFIWLVFVVCGYSQITISKPTFTFTKACASSTFNNYNFTFSVSTPQNIGAGNQFIVELSDASGSFASPTIVKTLTNTTQSISSSFSLPLDTYGENYALRVRSTNPVKTSLASNSFPAYYAIHRQPYSINNSVETIKICAGDQYSIQIDDTGTAASPLFYPILRYRWYKNLIIIPGQNGSSLTVTEPGSYYAVTDYGTCSYPSYSNAVTVIVQELLLPQITTDDGTAVLCPGATKTLTSSLQNVSYAYAWYKNNIVIAGQTGPTCQITEEGIYNLELTSNDCVFESNDIDIEAIDYNLAIDPAVATVLIPGDVINTTAITDAVAPSFQWQRNNVPISGATQVSYNITQKGNYKVVVNDPVPCNITKESAVDIYYPDSFDVAVGAISGYQECVSTATTLNIVGFDAITNQNVISILGNNYNYAYQWYKNNIAVTGGNAKQLLINDATQNGSYTLEVTIPDYGVVTSNAIEITLSFGNVVITGGTTICEGAIVALTSNITGATYSYQWFKNGAVLPAIITSTLAADSEGDYYVVVTGNGCTAQSNTIHIEKATIVVNSTNPAEDLILPGQTKTLTVTTDAILPVYDWFRNDVAVAGASATLTATKNGEYKVVVAQTSGCDATAEKTFVLNYPTGFELAIAETTTYTACTSTLANLDIASFIALTPNGNIDVTTLGYHYQWYRNGVQVAGATLASLSLSNASQNGDYKLEVTIPDFAPITSNTITINLAMETVTINGNAIICTGGTVELSSDVTNANYTYQWFKDSIAIPGAVNPTLTADNEGDYYLVVTGGSCTTQSNTIEIETAQIVVNSTNPATDIILPGQTKTLTVTTDAVVPQYTWYRNNITLAETTATLTATQNGTYKVVVTQTSGCNATAEKVFTLDYPTGFDITVATGAYTACTSTSVNLDITSFFALTPNGNVDVTMMGYQYQWYKDNIAVSGATSAQLLLTSALQNGNYRLEVTIPDFASITSNTVAVHLAVENIVITDSGVLCTGGTVALSTVVNNPDYTYQWFKNGVTIPGEVNSILTANAEGDYYLIVSKGSCTAQSNIIHLEIPQITVSSTNPAVDLILPGQTKTFTVTTDAVVPQYTWYRNNIALAETTATLTATQSGTYKVVVTQTSGCNATAEKTFTLDYPTGFNTTIGTGAYTVCTSATVNLDITSFFALTPNGNVDVTSLGYQYQWYKDNIAVSGATLGILSLTSASQNGTYKLGVTIPDFPELFSNAIAINLAIENVVITNSSALCEGATVLLSSGVNNPDYSYQWFENSTALPGAITPNFTATAEGDYYLVVTKGGCSVQSNIIHLQTSGITVSSSNPATDLILPGQTKTFTVTTDAAAPQYVWYRNDILLSETSASLNATQDGNYKVVVTQTLGCTAAEEKTFTLNYPTGFDITIAVENYTACTSTTVTLDTVDFIALTPNGNIDVTAMGYQYQWYKNNILVAGATSLTLLLNNASQNGTYKLGVTIPDFPELFSNAIEINLAIDAVTITAGSILCTGGTVTLSADINEPTYTYQWYRNNTVLASTNSATLMAASGGNYHLVVSNGSCTVQSNTITLNIAQITVNSTNLAIDVILPGQSKTLIVTTDAVAPQYAWYRNNVLLSETTAALTTTQNGVYKVVVTQTSGCNATAEKTFTLNDPNGFQIIIGSGTYTACTSTAATLDITIFVALTPSGNVDVTTMGYQYQWYKNNIAIAGETSAVLSLNTALQNGDYRLDVTIPGFPTVASNTITINLALQPIAISGNTILCADGTVTLSSDVNNSDYSYQWYKNGTILAAATDPVLIANAVGDYYLAVTGGNCTGQSNTIQLGLAQIVVNSSNPDVDVILPTQSKTITVTTDAAAPEYTWYLNNGLLTEITNSLVATENGEYKVVVTQTSGCNVTVEKTFILNYPTGFEVAIGSGTYTACTSTTAILDVSSFIAFAPTGNINVSITGYDYQWYKNDVPVPGATSSTLSIADASQNGEYKLSITIPGYAPVFSNIITINLSIVPAVISVSGKLCVNDPLPISNSFTDVSYTYTWFKDDVEVSSGNNPDYLATLPGNYYVSISKDGCTVISNTLLIEESDFNLSSSNPSTDLIIQGDSKALSVTTNALQPSFEWYRNDILLTGENTAIFTATQKGVYKVRVTQNDGCIITKELVFELAYPLGFSITIAPNEYEKCISTQTELHITQFDALTQSGAIDLIGNSYNYQYQWYKDNAIIAGANMNTLQVVENGIYILQVTIPDHGIITSDAIVIKLAFTDSVVISTEDVFCSEDAVVTIKSNVVNPDYSYAWYHDGVRLAENGSTITVADKGSYRLEVTYDDCTVISNVLELIPYDLSQVVIHVESIVDLPEGTSIIVTAEGAEVYEWYFEGKLVGVESSFKITEPGTYSVTARVGDCDITKQFVVGLIENVLIAIPNVVTPNNDGINDRWALPLKYLNDTTEVVIYAPDGTIVFRALHYNNDWPANDFTYSLKNPVYYYTIMENNKITKRGSITFVK
ncbi:hypothetical protein D3C87_289660 [compost metagenome]